MMAAVLGGAPLYGTHADKKSNLEKKITKTTILNYV